MYKPKYFSCADFFYSNTAIKNNIQNVPHDFRVLGNLEKLAEHLDKIREIFGKPITVNCAYRNSEVNRLCGGVPRSYHLVGRASDITSKSDLSGLRNAVLQYTGFVATIPKRFPKYSCYENDVYEVLMYDNFIHFAFKK